MRIIAAVMGLVLVCGSAGVTTAVDVQNGGSKDPPLHPAAEAAAKLPRLRSLLVSWRGSLVLERYFGGARATQPANIKSASKSVISALVGIAIARNVIGGVAQPITKFFPELAKDREARKRDITIEDLLTMRSGLESTSGLKVPNVRTVPEVPIGLVPSVPRLPQRSPAALSTCAHRTPVARHVAPRGLALSAPTSRHLSHCTHTRHRALVPDLDLVVVTTSRSDVSRERRDHLGAIYDLVEQAIIPAFPLGR
jgi:hypothetical protein